MQEVGSWKEVYTARDVVKIFSIFLGLFGFLLLSLKIISFSSEYLSIVVNFWPFIFAIGVFSFYLKKKKIGWSTIFDGVLNIRSVFFALGLSLFVLIVGGFLSNVFGNILGLSSQDTALLDALTSDNNWINFLSLKVGVAILIPFTEELLFRGVLFRYIRQEKSFLFSAILSALIFSSYHLSLATLPFTFLLGFATAYIYERYKSILLPFFVHMGVNSLAVNMILFSGL